MYKKNNKFVVDYKNAQLYDIMPNISKDLLIYIFDNIISKDDVLCDVGSGTGRLTRELLKNGNMVYAVEPDENMRKVCENNLSSCNKLVCIDGCDENTNLESHSIDYILVSQSLHRFNTEKFRKECSRILKNKNNIIVMWNRIHFGKPIFKELLCALKSVYPNYKSRFEVENEVYGSVIEMEANVYDSKSLIGNNMISKFFKNDYKLNHKDFRDLVLSLGLFPLADNSNNIDLLNNEIDISEFIKKIDKIFFKYAINDEIVLPFESDLHYYKGE